MNLTALSLALASALAAVVALPVFLADEPPAAQDAGPVEAPSPADFQPVADVASLMTGLGTAFGNIKDLARNPMEDHRLERLTAWAEVAAELSNVNTLHGSNQPYRDMAVDTRNIALEIAQAARAETPDDGQILSLVIRLDTSCSTCHDSDY